MHSVLHTVPFDVAVQEAVSRLGVEFADAVPDSTIRVRVAEARRELTGEPPPALPELVERLARVRLLDDRAALAARRTGRVRTPQPG